MIKCEVLNNPHEFFSELGDLHDARIERVQWLLHERRLTISIDDLYSNFLDLPEYKGLTPATIILNDVEDIEVNIGPVDDRINIFEFNAKVVDSSINVNVTCWPGGRIDIKCGSIQLHLEGIKT